MKLISIFVYIIDFFNTVRAGDEAKREVGPHVYHFSGFT